MNKVDKDIVKDILSGNDKKVINSLYQDIFPNVKRYLIKNNGNTEEAEDCFQEAIMKFYKQVLSNEFNMKYKVHGYIYSMSIRLWLNTLKKKKPTISFDGMDENFFNIDIQDHNIELKEGNEGVIMSILAKLGEKCKNLLHCTIYSDLLNEDIMIRYGYQSIAAVKMQHKRCKQKMIELLKLHPELESVLRS